MKNGELLAIAETQFDVFVTADQQLRYQQNLSDRRLALIVLPTNQVPLVVALIPSLRHAITGVKPGAYVTITLPRVP